MRNVEDEIMRNYRIVRNAEKEFIKEIANSHDPEEVKHRLKECIKAFHHPDNPEEAVLNACDHLTHEEMQAAAKLIALPQFPLKQLMNLDLQELKKPAKGWDVKRIGAVFLALALIVGAGGFAQHTGRIAIQNWPANIKDWTRNGVIGRWLSWNDEETDTGAEKLKREKEKVEKQEKEKVEKVEKEKVEKVEKEKAEKAKKKKAKAEMTAKSEVTVENSDDDDDNDNDER